MSHTLLLADDSVTIQRVIELTFADEDVNVVAVSDGEQAIAMLDKTPPDIVLADVGMPGRDGYQVAQHIRATPRLAHIPVVLLTGAFEPIDQAKAAAVGCDGVLAKPFEPQLVIGRVKELLARPKPAAPPLDAPLAPPAAKAGEAGAYFERLDQAFATISSEQGETRKPSALSTPTATALDWFASQPPPFDSAQGRPLDSGQGGPASSTQAPVADRAQGRPLDTVHSKPADTAYGRSADTVFGRSADTAYGKLADTVHGKIADPAHAKPTDTAYGRPADTSYGKPADTTQTRPATTLSDRWDLPPSAAAPAPPLAISYSSPPPPPPPVPPPAAPMPTLLPLADAFAALLAAEQSSPAPIAAPMWPALPQPHVAATDEVVEQVTRRVLDELTDRVVRETVAETVLTIAERLVREEIERIKNSIK